MVTAVSAVPKNHGNLAAAKFPRTALELPYAGYIHDTAPFEASNAAVVITILVQDRASIIPDL